MTLYTFILRNKIFRIFSTLNKQYNNGLPEEKKYRLLNK